MDKPNNDMVIHIIGNLDEETYDKFISFISSAKKNFRILVHGTVNILIE